MNKTTLTISAILISLASYAIGYAVKDPVEIRTVEREKIVHPDFEFNVGDKKYCDLGTQIKPCEIIGKKSSGLYVIKYNHDGIAGGEKIIDIPASDIVK